MFFPVPKFSPAPSSTTEATLKICLKDIDFLSPSLATILLEVLYLLHHLAENLRAVLRWIAVLDEADFNVKLELIADVLVVEPVGEGGFGVDEFLDFFG